MKTTVRLIQPSHGWNTIEIVYHTNTVGSPRLYSFDEMWESYRGDRVKQLDIDAVLSFNPYEEIQEAIVSKTQSVHRMGLEEDEKNPRISKKFNLKRKTNNAPD